MIEGQLPRAAAVLAAEAVAGHYSASGDTPALARRDLDVVTQTDDRGPDEGQPFRVDALWPGFHDLCAVFDDQNEGPLEGTYVDRLVCSVQDQNVVGHAHLSLAVG